MVQTGDFTCTTCRKKLLREQMYKIIEKEVHNDEVGTLYIRRGTCYRCAGVKQPKPEPDPAPAKLSTKKRKDGGKKK